MPEEAAPGETVSEDWTLYYIYNSQIWHFLEVRETIRLIGTAELQRCAALPYYTTPEKKIICEGVKEAVNTIEGTIGERLMGAVALAMESRRRIGRPPGPRPTPLQINSIEAAEFYRYILPYLEDILRYVEHERFSHNLELRSTFSREGRLRLVGVMSVWATLEGYLRDYILRAQMARGVPYIPITTMYMPGAVETW